MADSIVYLLFMATLGAMMVAVSSVAVYIPVALRAHARKLIKDSR